jgi:hypothetical protein
MATWRATTRTSLAAAGVPNPRQKTSTSLEEAPADASIPGASQCPRLEWGAAAVARRHHHMAPIHHGRATLAMREIHMSCRSGNKRGIECHHEAILPRPLPTPIAAGGCRVAIWEGPTLARDELGDLLPGNQGLCREVDLTTTMTITMAGHADARDPKAHRRRATAWKEARLASAAARLHLPVTVATPT